MIPVREPSVREDTVRDLVPEDLPEVARIHSVLARRGRTSGGPPVFEPPLGESSAVVSPVAGGHRLALVAEVEGRVAGYLVGEVRAFEFGSEPCGWVFALGVDPRHARAGIATALLSVAADRFRSVGVTKVRTMIRTRDVPLLAVFRSNGYVGGPFLQLERDLEAP